MKNFACGIEKEGEYRRSGLAEVFGDFLPTDCADVAALRAKDSKMVSFGALRKGDPADAH